MYVEGYIGKEVLIKGKIVGIKIRSDETVEYNVTIPESYINPMNYNVVVVQDKIVFPEEEVKYIPEEPADPSGEFEPLSEEYNDDLVPEEFSGLPVDDEWSRPAPKKRGRPRKATVEDLITKTKGVKE